MEPTPARKPRCLCRHEEHEGGPCLWQSPGGDLVGMSCNCESYRPCLHPLERRGPNNHFGDPTCGACTEHFKSEEDYAQARAAGERAEKLAQLLDQMPTCVTLTYGRTDGGSDEDPEVQPTQVVTVFRFSEKGFGFGEISIVQTKEGCFIDTECMRRETVKRFLCALVDGAVADTDTDPAKHLLYNEVMGRRCGGGCTICHPPENV